MPAHEVQHGGSAFGIGDRGDISLGFIEEHVDELLRAAQRTAVYLDVSTSGSALEPSSVTVWPFTETSPEVINSSALRREEMPAAAMIFWRRSAGIETRGLRFLIREYRPHVRGTPLPPSLCKVAKTKDLPREYGARSGKQRGYW